MGIDPTPGPDEINGVEERTAVSWRIRNFRRLRLLLLLALLSLGSRNLRGSMYPTYLGYCVIL